MTPDIEDGLAPEVGLPVGGMRSAQDQQVALGDHFVEWSKLRVGCHERVGGQDRARLPVQDLLELVAE